MSLPIVHHAMLYLYFRRWCDPGVDPSLSPVYTSNFYVTSFIYLPVYAPSTRAILIWNQQIWDWDLRMTSKNCQFYVFCYQWRITEIVSKSLFRMLTMHGTVFSLLLPQNLNWTNIITSGIYFTQFTHSDLFFNLKTFF